MCRGRKTTIVALPERCVLVVFWKACFRDEPYVTTWAVSARLHAKHMGFLPLLLHGSYCICGAMLNERLNVYGRGVGLICASRLEFSSGL